MEILKVTEEYRVNLEEEVKACRFREDLYYRLNVVHLKVPSLKEREDDLPLLIDSFIKKFAAENEKEIIEIFQDESN